MREVNGIKICACCKDKKAVDNFGKDKNRTDGLNKYCKPCDRQKRLDYRAANLEQERARGLTFYHANKDKFKEYKAANRDSVAQYQKEYAANNILRLREIKLAHYHRNAEKYKKQKSEYQKNNKDKINAKNAKRRSSKFNATPSWVNEAAIAKVYEKAQEISLNTGVEWHVDHIVPLHSDIVCGLHCEDNIQVIPGHENISKGNRRWPDMPDKEAG